MALLISRFASGVIAMVSRTSPLIKVPGYVPTKASALTIDDWHYIIFILMAAVGLQVALSVLAAAMAARVVMPPGGATAIAHVMQPMMASKEEHVKMESIYRCRKVSDNGVYDLYLEGRPRNRGETK